MSGLVWSRRAVADLERLHDASAKRGADLSRRAARAIREGLRVIAARPEAGRPVGGADPAFRERPVAFVRGGGCLLLYRADGARVVILACGTRGNSWADGRPPLARPAVVRSPAGKGRGGG